MGTLDSSQVNCSKSGGAPRHEDVVVATLDRLLGQSSALVSYAPTSTADEALWARGRPAPDPTLTVGELRGASASRLEEVRGVDREFEVHAVVARPTSIIHGGSRLLDRREPLILAARLAAGERAGWPEGARVGAGSTGRPGVWLAGCGRGARGHPGRSASIRCQAVTRSGAQAQSRGILSRRCRAWRTSPGRGGEQPEPQRFGFGDGQGAVEGEVAQPGGKADGEGGELQSGGVARPGRRGSFAAPVAFNSLILSSTWAWVRCRASSHCS